MTDEEKIDMAFVHAVKEYLMQKSSNSNQRIRPVYSLPDFYEAIQGCSRTEREFYKELFLTNLESRLKKTGYDEEVRNDILYTAQVAAREILRRNRDPKTISTEEFYIMVVSGRNRYIEGELLKEFKKLEEMGELDIVLDMIFGKKR
ncbi:MAG: hypothetical protein QXU82_02365 [Candidatus Aenigmatarchaeota archaeon]